MSTSAQNAIDDRLRRFERRLPGWAAGLSRWVRQASPWVRNGMGCALVLGGLAGFLPVLGFWMLPLGLILLAKDVSFLRAPLIHLLDWIDRKWPAPKSSSR